METIKPTTPSIIAPHLATDSNTYPIFMYYANWCGYSQKAIALLKQYGLDKFTRMFDVDKEVLHREDKGGMSTWTGQTSVPQIYVFHKPSQKWKHVKGFEALQRLLSKCSSSCPINPQTGKPPENCLTCLAN
jgi:glutaredoxin-related protein